MSEPLDLHVVERTVGHALDRGSDAGLRILGYGEITLVLGWPTAAPVWACKRLPVFPSLGVAARFGELFATYSDLLRARGVEPVPSEFRTVDLEQGVAGYVVQPVLPPGSLGPAILRDADPDPAHPLIQAVCAAVPEVVDERTGLDGQISNWALRPGADTAGVGVHYLDLTTPMLFDASGRPMLDLDLFLAAYPWLLRPPIRRFIAPGVIGAYRDARHVLVDMTANLLKERLERWVPAVLEAVNAIVQPAVTESEVRKYYSSDARLWEIMLRLRRADRWWQRRVRRRPYPFLLPGPIDR